MPRVLVTVSMLFGRHGPWRQILESAGFDVVFPQQIDRLHDVDHLARELTGIDAVLCSVEPYSRAVLESSKLRAIARCGVGYDSIDVAAATDLGIPVTITPGANEISVAEQALAMILAVSRGYPQRDLAVRRGEWPRVSLPRLAGQTLGLLGLGRIGKAVATRAIALGLKVIAFDPAPDLLYCREHKIELLASDDVLRMADYLSLHLPWTPATHDFMNARTFGLLKRGAVFINTARGGLVDEEALVAALRSGQLRAAALDVFKTEPLPPDSPLREFDNVLLSPHMAGLDLQSQDDMSALAAQCLADCWQGRWPEGCVVNDAIRSSYRW